MTPNAQWVLVVGEDVFEISSAVPGDATAEPEDRTAGRLMTFGVAAVDRGRLAGLAGRTGHLLGADGTELALVRIRKVDLGLSVLVAVLEPPAEDAARGDLPLTPEPATL